jgi:hypothetical protein
MRKLGSTLIRKFGTTITITQTDAGGYDEATQTEVSTTVTYTGVPALFEDFKAFDIDGDMVKHGDLKVHIPAADFDTEPQKGRHTITTAGRTYTVERTLGTPSGNQQALWTIQVRR